ncbi:MAG: NfeD family protein [Bacteroidales bacterium]|nr:NfeD family protein [Bacteroidales bacterium]
MSILAIVFLIVLGIVLLLVEFLVIPGITIAGIGGFLLIAGGVFCGYYFHEPRTGNIILLSTLGLLIITVTLSLRLKTWQRLGLNATIDGKVAGNIDSGIVVGDTGETISRLNPIGKAMFNGKMFEVRSDGNYIDQHKEIVVTRVDKNKIYVETKN